MSAAARRDGWRRGLGLDTKGTWAQIVFYFELKRRMYSSCPFGGPV